MNMTPAPRPDSLCKPGPAPSNWLQDNARCLLHFPGWSTQHGSSHCRLHCLEPVKASKLIILRRVTYWHKTYSATGSSGEVCIYPWSWWWSGGEGYICPWSGYDDERWVCCAVQAEVVVWHQTQYSVTQHSSPHSHQPGQWWEWHIRARPIITKERTVWSNELGPAVSIEYNPSRITFEVRPISRVIWLWRGRMEDHGPDVFPI